MSRTPIRSNRVGMYRRNSFRAARRNVMESVLPAAQDVVVSLLAFPGEHPMHGLRVEFYVLGDSTHGALTALAASSAPLELRLKASQDLELNRPDGCLGEVTVADPEVRSWLILLYLTRIDPDGSGV